MVDNIASVPDFIDSLYQNSDLCALDNMILVENFNHHPDPGQQCSACGHQNQENVKFCLNCGTAMNTGACAACHQPVVFGQKFCGNCGTQLNGMAAAPLSIVPTVDAPATLPAIVPSKLADKIRAASVKTSGERREVTVLFLDITNFTATSFQLDSEEVYIFIDEAMSLLVEVLHKYEGTVDKFTGDGLMALFGAPSAHENDPERAVRAALEMQEILKPLQRRLKEAYGIDFRTRIGLNTGLVIAGNLGSNFHTEYTVIGDTVNLASRLETAAQPDTVLVSEETYYRTRRLFRYESLPPFSPKGVPHPIKAFRPLGLREKPQSVRGIDGVETSLIGRRDSLAQMADALSETQQHGLRKTVFITGEAGVGKSRLTAEFLRSLAPGEVKVFQGGCLSYAQARPLWVVAELLKDITRIPETAPDELRRKTLQNYLERLRLPADDLLPYLGHVLGLTQSAPDLQARIQPLDAAMLQRQTHAALRQLLLAEARVKPTLLIFEDLHWVDPASRNFLDFLIQTSSNEPFFLILICRQAERETVIQSLLDAANQEPDRLVDIQLQGLSESEGEQLTAQLIKQTGPEAEQLRKRIVARAAGNPFYVEEIIRMLIDQQGLVPGANGHDLEMTARANELLGALPGTVKGLILARFDRLPEGLRQTLQKAAVLGQSFLVSLLEKLSGTTREMLHLHLSELEQRQFLMSENNKNGWRYKFQHALLQEAVYSTLLKRDRRNWHTKAARAIESDTSYTADEKNEALAFHYARSTTANRAIPYLLTTAENAARRCAYEIAAENYRQAKDLLPDQPSDNSNEYFEVRIGLGAALKFVGDFTGASQVLLEGIQQLWESSFATEPTALWPILVKSLREMADVRQREGSYDEAVTYLDAGLQLLGEDGAKDQPEIWCSVLDRMAWIRFRQGQLEEASTLAKAAILTCSKAGLEDPIRLASLHNTLGGISWQQGNLEQASGYVERCRQLYDSVGYLWGRSVAYANLGVLSYAQGNWAKASSYYKQAYNLQQTIGDLPHQAISLENLGLLHTTMGQHTMARHELEASLALRQRLGDAWGMAQSHLNLAPLAIILGHQDEAVTHAEAALALAETSGSDETGVRARCILALVTGQQNGLEAGLSLARETLETAQTRGFKDAEIEGLRVLGILSGQAHNHYQAVAYLTRSYQLACQQNARYQSGQAQLELGRILQQLAQAEPQDRAKWQAQAADSLHQAAKTFTNLGAAYDLRLAQTMLGQLYTE